MTAIFFRSMNDACFPLPRTLVRCWVDTNYLGAAPAQFFMQKRADYPSDLRLTSTVCHLCAGKASTATSLVDLAVYMNANIIAAQAAANAPPAPGPS